MVEYGTRGPKTPKTLRDRDMLNELYVHQGLSQAAIGDRLGCGSSTVSRWLRYHDIPTRRSGGRTPYEKLSDENWLREQHIEQRKSMRQIGNEIGCHETTVLRWLNMHEIEYWTTVLIGEDCPAYIDGRSRERAYGGYFWQKQRQKAIERDDHQCQECGITADDHKDWVGRDLDVHHIIPYRTFESDEDAHQLDNLITLCKTCHKASEPSD